GASDVGIGVKDLTLKVRPIHPVEVHDPERADAGRGQIQGDRRAEPSGPDDEHLRFDQLALTGPADVRKDDVPGVALDLILGERRAPTGVAHVIVNSSSVTSPSTIENDRITGFSRSASPSRMYLASG